MVEEFKDAEDDSAPFVGAKKQPKQFSKARMRNLHQYKNLTDAEYEEVYAKKLAGVHKNKEFEDRIDRKIKEISKDYDLNDLNSNDILTLRALAQAYINLEDYEDYEYTIRTDKSEKGGINEYSMSMLEKLSKMKDVLRQSISSMSGDLKITRKVRVADKDQSVLSYIEDLKKKAKEFYESKMQLIFCPKCNTWIGSIWTLYPMEKGNKITLVCDRHYEDGTTCGEKIVLTTVELTRMGGNNKTAGTLPISLT
jgi:hypothetical protein